MYDEEGSMGFLDVDDKRNHHNNLERQRRNHIKTSFTKLGDLIPSLKNDSKNSSRAAILKEATEFIGKSVDLDRRIPLHISKVCSDESHLRKMKVLSKKLSQAMEEGNMMELLRLYIKARKFYKVFTKIPSELLDMYSPDTTNNLSQINLNTEETDQNTDAQEIFIDVDGLDSSPEDEKKNWLSDEELAKISMNMFGSSMEKIVLDDDKPEDEENVYDADSSGEDEEASDGDYSNEENICLNDVDYSDSDYSSETSEINVEDPDTTSASGSKFSNHNSYSFDFITP